MNPVDYSISRVMSSDIDDYLLKLTFENPNSNFSGNWYNLVNQTTVPNGIREKVIHRTVLPACNVNGGKTEFIDLSSSRMTDLGNGCVEVNVNDIVTGGRKIIGVIEVYLGSMTSATGMLGMGVNENNLCGQGTVNDMTQGLIDGLTSNRSMPITYTNTHMTGNNCFVIFGLNTGTYSMSAKVTMEYDEGLSSIHPHHYEYFADLVELATKAYVYRSCRRPTQEAVIRSGVTLDDIRDDIMEFRGAWDDYKEYLKTTWTKCMTYSDAQRVYDSVRHSVVRRM